MDTLFWLTREVYSSLYAHAHTLNKCSPGWSYRSEHPRNFPQLFRAHEAVRLLAAARGAQREAPAAKEGPHEHGHEREGARQGCASSRWRLALARRTLRKGGAAESRSVAPDRLAKVMGAEPQNLWQNAFEVSIKRTVARSAPWIIGAGIVCVRFLNVIGWPKSVAAYYPRELT